MIIKKSATLTSSLLIKKGSAEPVSLEKKQKPKMEFYKSLTVKLDRDRYEKLKRAGITLDKKSQEIFLEALDLWFCKNPHQ